MSRPKKDYGLWLNSRTGIYYYRIADGPWRSTGCKGKTAADRVAREKWKAQEIAVARPRSAGGTVRTLLDPYFDWDRCPRIADRRLEGKRIARQHATRQRALLEKYVFEDKLASLELRNLTVDEIKAFRLRLAEKTGPRSVNAVLTALKTCFNDALERELIRKNPMKPVGKLSYRKREAGIFSGKELAALFPVDGLGTWTDPEGYVAFMIAATCGLRRGEILALQWGDIDVNARILHVQRAWKDEHELGEPKWGQVRDVPLPATVLQRLKELKAESLHVLPGGLIFADPWGKRRGTTWFSRRFHDAMKTAGIDTGARGLTPHSFRHSLNTLLRDQGVPDEKIRAVMGWSNPETQAGYTHWKPEHLRDQADLIDILFTTNSE